MRGHLTRSLSLALLACSVVACTPKSPEESATDTDSATSDSTSATSDSTSATGDITTGTTGDTGGEACLPPDPAAKAAVSLDFHDWPLVVDAYPERKRAAADCTVQTTTGDGGTIAVELLCSQADLGLTDMPIGLSVTGPADFAIDLVAGDAVALDAFWEGDAVDYVGGQWFTLHSSGGDLLLAGLEYHSATAANEALAPLTIATVAGACEATCESGCMNPEWDMVERLALDFTHTGGTTVQVLDEGRAQLIADGLRHDIVVGQAEYWSCLNCGSDYLWIVRQADQP